MFGKIVVKTAYNVKMSKLSILLKSSIYDSKIIFLGYEYNF